MTKKTIPNWTVFATHSVGLSIIKITEDNKEVYQAVYDITLDDSTPLSENDDDNSHISIWTDIQTEDKIEAINLAMPPLLTSFSSILNEVFVFDSEHNIIETLQLNEVYDDPAIGDYFEDESDPVIH